MVPGLDPSTPPAPAALVRLRPRPVDLPPVVHRADLGPLAWAGMLADGALVPLRGDVARTTGTAETPAVRAAAVARLVPPRGVVGRTAAVWVHTGGPPPRRVDVLVASGARRPDPHPDRRVAEAVLGPEDVVALGPVRVTTPLRTALDVARWETSASAQEALARLASAGVDLVAALRALHRFEGHRGVRSGRAALVAACAVRRG
ncbi:hypothetical protein [Cellulomonas sp.]|uniref:hypothetical protein n=1 Tax=Cellulomonas sp. TaxID=40001 RepID=UPI002811BBBD|nr:hypothetical protein [Cellulomonas sp.]